MNNGIFYVSNMFVTASKMCEFFHENAHFFEIEDERKALSWYGKWAGAVRPIFITRTIE